MSGYIRLHRSLIGHPAFRNDAEAMAFAWMVARAQWRPARLRYKGLPVELQRGQLCVSQRDMATAMDRDKAWIERLWKRLIREAMIEAKREAAAMVITICNYEKFQNPSDEREAAGEAVQHPLFEAGVRQGRGTEQIRERREEEEEGTLPLRNGSAAAAPPDPEKTMFDAGVKMLMAEGKKEGAARAHLGKWKRDFGVEAVIIALGRAQRHGAVDTAGFVEGLLRQGQRQRNDDRITV